MPPKAKGAKGKRGKKEESNVSLADIASDKTKAAKLMDNITATGVLTSLPLSVDIKIENFSLNYFGTELITNTTIELNCKRRYGLLGANGCGKSIFLHTLAARAVPVPEHLDIYFVNEEVAPTTETAMECVLNEVRKEQERLEKEIDELAGSDDPDAEMLLETLYERLDAMEPSTFETRAATLLHGLGFDQDSQKKMTKDMSGGWRMRVALAKALFIKPAILLLDEPTNHLDLEACVWLEEYLKNYPTILVLVSHSQDFLNGVCTNIMHLHRKKLEYYTGNYNSYVKTREEKETNQMKAYFKQQAEIEHIKKFIASCGTFANLVRQAKSKQKILDKMEADGLIEKVKPDPVFTFRFTNSGKLPPPVLAFDDVVFGYSPDRLLYDGVNLAIDMDSRVALVGPNGVGKSTLLKLMCGDLSPLSGKITRHSKLKLGRYHQHSVDQLDMDKSAVEYFRDKFSHMELSIDQWRKQLGQFGLTGDFQTRKMLQLSDGQRSRVVFCELAIDQPNLLLLDEPTNHLDIECIDSLAEAIKAYDGGVVLVSHDFRLIDQVAETILVCNKKNVTRWEQDIREYKEYLKRSMKF